MTPHRQVLPTDPVLDDDGNPTPWTEADFGCIGPDSYVLPGEYLRLDRNGEEVSAEADTDTDDDTDPDWLWTGGGPGIPVEQRPPMPAQRRTVRGVLREALRGNVRVRGAM